MKLDKIKEDCERRNKLILIKYDVEEAKKELKEKR